MFDTEGGGGGIGIFLPKLNPPTKKIIPFRKFSSPSPKQMLIPAALIHLYIFSTHMHVKINMIHATIIG